jgi:hypothetical protein
MMFGMFFGCFLSVMGGLYVVSMGGVGMVRGFLVITSFMVFCRFLMMTSSVLVMFGSFFVMFCGFL